MVVTNKTYLPTDEELTVTEIPLGTPYLRAGAFHLGKVCEAQNNEFMLCRKETDDPRACIKEGKEVTSCTMEFFQKVKSACASEFTQYAMCLEKSSKDMEFRHCRVTQGAFDKCLEDNYGFIRPFYGYHSLTRIHDSSRPAPEETRPKWMDDPRGKRPKRIPADLPIPHHGRDDSFTY